MSTIYPGYFISFEGIDGAGKSTHIDAFGKLLQSRYPHQEVVMTREPGGTLLGEQLRNLLLESPMNLETEALLMFAARREHLAQVIEPALKAGKIVISDRFTDASFAYQGGGRGLSLIKLNELELWVQGRENGALLQPNLTILFDQALLLRREGQRYGRQINLNKWISIFLNAFVKSIFAAQKKIRNDFIWLMLHKPKNQFGMA